MERFGRVARRLKESAEKNLVGCGDREGDARSRNVRGDDPCGVDQTGLFAAGTPARSNGGGGETRPTPSEFDRLARRAKMPAARRAQPGDELFLERFGMPGNQGLRGAELAGIGAHADAAALAGGGGKKSPAPQVAMNEGARGGFFGAMPFGGIQLFIIALAAAREAFLFCRLVFRTFLCSTPLNAKASARSAWVVREMARGAAGGAFSAHPSLFS